MSISDFSILFFFSLLNFQKENDSFFNKKVNLGLDLQGGSYLLLEIDTEPLIKERLQSKVIPLKKLLKNNAINYNNFSVTSKNINFDIDKKHLLKFEKFLK